MAEKILIVDDEKDIRNMLRDYFELQGYEIYTAAGGEEALEKMKIQPDMILLDINMPDMDGYEVCKKDQGSCELSHFVSHCKGGGTGQDQWTDDWRR